MNDKDDKFDEVADIFMKELTNFIKQLLSIHLKVSTNGLLSMHNETPKNKLLFLQQQLVQEKLEKASLDFGINRAAGEIAQSEVLTLAFEFPGPSFKGNKDIEYDFIFENVAVQYCINKAIMHNVNEVFNGGFIDYMEDALNQSYLIVKGFFRYYKAQMDRTEPDENLYWQFIMFSRRLLPSKLRHWYLTKMQSYRYIQGKYKLAKQKKGYKRRIIPVEDKFLKRMPANNIHHRTIIDKYGEAIGDKSYCQLIQEVKEERNPRYAMYLDGSYRERKTYKMIALEHNVSEGAVKSGVSRGLAYLRRKYNKTATI